MLPLLDRRGSRVRDVQDEAVPWWKAYSQSRYRGEITKESYSISRKTRVKSKKLLGIDRFKFDRVGVNISSVKSWSVIMAFSKFVSQYNQRSLSWSKQIYYFPLFTSRKLVLSIGRLYESIRTFFNKCVSKRIFIIVKIRACVV